MAIATLEEKAAALQKSHPGLSGQLVRPNLGELRQALAAAESSVDRDPARAVEAARAVGNVALAQVQEIEKYPADGKALAAVPSRLAELERRKRAAAADGALELARRSLAEARELYGRGDPNYAKPLASVRTQLAEAEGAIAAADRIAAFRRLLLGLLLALLALAIGGTGLFLNRRRRGAKREAEELLAAWQNALNTKLDALFGELEQRVARFVGPVAGEGKRPHAGETLRLAGEVREDVGSLSILWTSARSVLEKAERLIAARGLAAAYNLFFPEKYRQGIRLLKEEPVPFDPADGLPQLFGAERTWRDDLLGDLASYQPFAKTFAEIVGESTCAPAAPPRRSTGSRRPCSTDPPPWTRSRRRSAPPGPRGRRSHGRGRRRALPPAGARGAALPAAAAALARARESLPTDPVGAMEGTAPRPGGSRRTPRGSRRSSPRRGREPAGDRRGAAALSAAGHPTGWIDAASGRLSAEADRIAAKAAVEPAAREIEALAARAPASPPGSSAPRRWREPSARPPGRRSGAAATSSSRPAATPARARARSGAMLREAGSDPSERLDAASHQADVAQSALGEGDLEAAAAALAEAARLTSQANGIVEATRRPWRRRSRPSPSCGPRPPGSRG